MAATATLSILGFLLLCVLVIAPAIVGLILIIKSRGRGPKFPSCGGCGYDVTGSVGSATRCPECGKDFLEVGIRPPGGRRSAAMLWSGILIMAIPVTCVGFGGVLSMMSAARMTQARQAATAAQAQAIAAQQAQANAMFPIPAPLTDEQIGRMSIEEASAAMGMVSAALNRTDLTAEDRSRLEHEKQLLTQQSGRPATATSPDKSLPTPLTDEQINAMTLKQAQDALTRVSVARRLAVSSPDDKSRLRTEFGKLLNHISILQGKGPVVMPATSPAIGAGYTPLGNVPPPLTNEQIDRMTLTEAQEALSRVSVARRQALISAEQKTRLKSEFDRLLARISAIKKEP